MVFGLAVSLAPPDGPTRFLVQGTIFLSTMLVMFLLGAPLIRAAWSESIRGRISIEALFLLTLTGALIASIQSWLTHDGPIYFEVVSVLLVIYTFGKMIGANSRANALRSSKQWETALSTCRVILGGQPTSLDVSRVRPGDLIEVRPGELIPVDGVIREGTGFIAESAITGEPFAVVRRPGDKLLAGSVSQDATFRIEATSAGASREIDRLLRIVEQAREHPISLQSQAARLASVFLPLIVGVAISTFAVWSYSSTWQTALFHAMSVLLVACPCALGLATPVIVWTTLNRLAECGVIAQKGDIVERLANDDTIIFDKTGTLTSEQFALIDIATVGDERAKWLTWLSIIEEQSSHPVAKPFAKLPRTASLTKVKSLRVEPGCGISADVDDGEIYRVRVGRSAWIAAENEQVFLDQLLTLDGHRIDFEVDGELRAVAIVRERLRDSVSETLDELSEMGYRVGIMTGDSAPRFEFEQIETNLRPHEKQARIEELQQNGSRVLMIGDGINDASAMAISHVSIALSSGTDLAMSTASATLYHDDLKVIPWALSLSRGAIRQVRWNLRLAAGYNLIGIGLAAAGVLHPVVAALLMVMSSLIVVWSSTRVQCECEPLSTPRSTLPLKTFAHFIAIAAQGWVAVQLLDLSRFPVLLMFTICGALLAILFHRWKRIPHTIDMTIGMLSLGNFGMLLGWWADLGFSPLPHNEHTCCVDAIREGIFRPWMWLGMLVFANIAMLWLMRRPVPECRFAMFTGGNIGMVLGMWGGGYLFGQWEFASTISASMSFGGMTIGMVVGMIVGMAIVQPLICLTK